jgi:hypothetical protein
MKLIFCFRFGKITYLYGDVGFLKVLYLGIKNNAKSGDFAERGIEGHLRLVFFYVWESGV